MSVDLAVDEFEAALGIGDLLAEVGAELSEKVSVFASGGLRVEVQLGEFAGEQRIPLGVEGDDIALGMLDLARDAEKLNASAFSSDGGVDFAVVVKQTLKGFGVAATVGLIGAGHQ
jgi:hypothetical protein